MFLSPLLNLFKPAEMIIPDHVIPGTLILNVMKLFASGFPIAEVSLQSSHNFEVTVVVDLNTPQLREKQQQNIMNTFLHATSF